MPNILILDDDPQRHKVFLDMFARSDIIIRQAFTARQACHWLGGKERFDLVCLDHDLGEFDNSKLFKDPGSGMDVAEFIALHMPLDDLPRQILIHSWNAPAAKRMAEILREAACNPLVTPFKATWKKISDIGS